MQKSDPADYSIIGWLNKHAIKTESGKPYDLRQHFFWYDVLTDWNPEIVLLKAAQMGGTTTLAIKLLWAMHQFKLNAAYTMPTSDDAKQFVGGRLNAIIRENPILASYVHDKDSVEQKQVGKNIVHFRGTWTERTAISFPSDLNVHDEEDRSKREVVEQYASRLQHSNFKWQWHLSNPSTPGNGVDKYWKESDQKHWFIKCPACSKKQFLSWPENIDVARETFICKHCFKDLPDSARRVGDWHGIKSETKPRFSGYWFSLLMAPWVTAKQIIELNRTKSPEYFANFVLGIPYAGNGSKLLEEDFFQNLVSEKNMQDDPIVIGVDTGIPCWYVVGNRQGIFFQGKCDSMYDIEVLMKRFPKAIVVCDQGGDLTAPRELREKYRGRVYLAFYRQDRKTMRLIEWGEGDELGKVTIDRNRVIQQIMDEFRDKRLPVFGTKEDWWELWTHIANMYRTTQEDALGQERHVWERSGPDHLFHALLYMRVGLDKFMGKSEQRFAGGDDIGKMLNVKPSFFASGDGTMPSRFPDVEQSKDWRD